MHFTCMLIKYLTLCKVDTRALYRQEAASESLASEIFFPCICKPTLMLSKGALTKATENSEQEPAAKSWAVVMSVLGEEVLKEDLRISNSPVS